MSHNILQSFSFFADLFSSRMIVFTLFAREGIANIDYLNVAF